jgi:hypothetical protein
LAREDNGGVEGIEERVDSLRHATYRELARLIVDANVRDVHGIRRRRYRGPPRGAQHAAHEARECALLLCAAGEALLREAFPAPIAVSVGLRVGRRGRRRLHFGVEGARLPQISRGLVGVRVRWARWPTWCSAVGGVERFLDDRAERLPNRGRRKVRNRGRKLRRGMVYMRVFLLLVDGRERRTAAERRGSCGSAKAGMIEIAGSRRCSLQCTRLVV